MKKKLYWMVDLLTPLILLVALYSTFSILEWREIYIWLGVFSGVFLFVGTYSMQGYVRYSPKSLTRKLQIVFKVWAYVLLASVLIVYLTGGSDLLSRKLFIIWALSLPFVILVLKFIISTRVSIKISPLHVLMVGDRYGFTEQEQLQLERHNIVMKFASLSDVLEMPENSFMNNLDIIVLNVNEKSSNKLISKLTRIELKGIRLQSMNHFFEDYLRKYYISYEVKGIDYLDDVHGYMKSQYFFKRAVDYTVSVLLLVFSFPILLYSALKVKLESPGTLFFKQSRVGLAGKEFNVVKFRTMHENCHFNPYTEKEDPRIFPFGKLMRKSRIDEVPQIWNVMIGDMHLLGPRTEWCILVENYEKEIPYYHERHLVRPGISGWAQVMYPYGENVEDARQKLMYDLYYIKHWNIWLEIETIIRTVGVIVGRKGL